MRVGSRRGSPPFDWDDPSTWPAVLEGAGAVYLCFAPDLAVPGAAQTVAAVAASAVDTGASRVVLLSGRGEPGAQRAEQAVQDVAEARGASWTVVRCAWFAQSFSETFLRDAVLNGVVALPVSGVVEPFVDVDDVAEVVTRALTEPGHDGRVHELTGPRLMDFSRAVAEVAETSGRPVRFETISMSEHLEALRREGVPPVLVDLMAHLFTDVLDGRNAHVTGDLEEALGRAAGDLRDHARRAAGSGAWA